MKMLYLSESLYKENPLQVNRCRGDQILYGIYVAVVMEAPFHDFIKNGLKIVSFFRERVLYMGRDFIELFPFDEPVRFQLAESLRKGCIRDYFEHPFQKSESCRIVDTEFIKDLGFPLSLQHQEERRDGTVAEIGHDSFFHIDQVFFVCHVFHRNSPLRGRHMHFLYLI